MKKAFILFFVLALMVSCKENSKEVPDVLPAKSADTLKKDSVAVAAELENPSVADQTEEAVKETAEPAIVVKETTTPAKVSYASFGDKISDANVLSNAQMMKKYAALKKGDTIQVKFKSHINDVCKKKGCWMSMDLAGDKTAFVRFRDYGFFVPLNADGSDAIVSGKAFIDVVSVEELKHYAKDGGKSVAEIEKITEPKVTYAFQADGVLIQQ